MSRKSLIVLAILILGLGAFWLWIKLHGGSYTFDLSTNNMNSSMKIESPVFKEGEMIDAKYTCDGDNISPPLQFSGIPTEAKTLVLVMDDPDVPKEVRPDGVFDHWVIYNIPPSTTGIPAGGAVGAFGDNGAGKAAYTGPCPPTQYEPSTHRYVFTLYATDISTLNFIKAPTKQDVLTAIDGHILEKAELVGRYKRSSNQ